MATINDLSVRVSSQTADFQAGMQAAQSGLSGLRSDAIQTAAAMQILQGRVDEAGDEAMTAGAQAGASSGGFASAAGAAAGAEISFGSLSVVTAATLIPSLLTLTTVLAPLVTALGGFITVAGAIGGVGLVGFIGAAMTETESLQRSFDQLVSTVQSEFAPVFEIFSVVLNSLIRDLTDIIPQLVPAEDAVESIAVSFMTLGEAVISSLPAFVDLAVTLTERFLPAFTRWAQGVLPQIPGMLAGLIPTMLEVGQALGPLVDSFLEIAPTMTEFGMTVLNVIVPALEGFLGIWNDAMASVNSMESGMSELVTQFTIVSPIIAAVATSIAGVSAPVLAVIAAVSALVVAFQQDFGGLQTIVQNFTADLQRSLGSNIPTLFENVVTIIQAILTVVEPIFSALAELFAVTLVNAIDLVVTTLTAVSELLTGDFQGAFETVAAYFGRYKERLSSLFGGFIEPIQDWVSNAISVVGTLVQNLPEMMRNAAITGISTLISIYQSGFNRIANFISGIWNGISETLISAFNGIVERITSGINALIGTVNSAAEKVPGFDLNVGEVDAPSLDQEALNLGTDRTTNVGELQSQNEQTIRVVLDEQTDVVSSRIQQGAEMVVEDRERRTQRNSGRNPNPR